MKQAFLKEMSFQILEKDIPAVSGNLVLVKTAGCGVCEGDLFQFSQSADNHELLSLGHEASGIVEKVGPLVKNFKPGDKVTSLKGSYSEYFCSEEEFLAKIPEGIDTESALGEPLACCVHAAEHFNIHLGDKVALIGCGYMGMVCLQLALLQGASHITAFDLMEWRLKDAETHGADRIVNPLNIDSSNLPEDLKDFDVVIEATGASSAISLGTALLRHHGTLTLVGYHQSENGIRHINMKEWNYKAITVVNGHIRNMQEKRRAMEVAMKLKAGGKLDTEFLVKDFFFEDINRAFQELLDKKEGLYKANILFEKL